MEYTDYCFSFFRKPIQNIEPLRAIGVVDVYRYVVGTLTIALSPVFSASGMKRN